jgi:hypothetical protein
LGDPELGRRNSTSSAERRTDAVAIEMASLTLGLKGKAKIETDALEYGASWSEVDRFRTEMEKLRYELRLHSKALQQFAQWGLIIGS